jgi:hypothetical protein
MYDFLPTIFFFFLCLCEGPNKITLRKMGLSLGGAQRRKLLIPLGMPKEGGRRVIFLGMLIYTHSLEFAQERMGPFLYSTEGRMSSSLG